MGAASHDGGRLAAYEAGLLALLDQSTSVDKHADVLSHLLDHLKGRLTEGEREEYRDSVALYREGALPLAAPLALANKHIDRHAPPFLAAQTYLKPHPLESALG